MDKERISADEILNQIRAIGYERFDQVKWVILEPDGKISCIPYDPQGLSKSKEKLTF